MLEKHPWLVVGAMEIDSVNDIESIHICAMEVEQLLPEAKERIEEMAMLDYKYWEIYK